VEEGSCGSGRRCGGRQAHDAAKQARGRGRLLRQQQQSRDATAAGAATFTVTGAFFESRSHMSEAHNCSQQTWMFSYESRSRQVAAQFEYG
jgi:hypothetical protein